LRCIVFFKTVQMQWLAKSKQNQLDTSVETIVNGGMISIFELIEQIKKACGKEHRQFSINLRQNLKPDFFHAKDGAHEMLEFTILKVVTKVTQLGNDMKSIYDSWDADGNGYLDAQEICKGIT